MNDSPNNWRFAECVVTAEDPLDAKRLKLSYSRMFDKSAPWLIVQKMFHLTAREIQCVVLTVRGVPAHQIAEGMGIAYQTWKEHRKAAYKKMGVRCVEQMVTKAILASGLLLTDGKETVDDGTHRD